MASLSRAKGSRLQRLFGVSVVAVPCVCLLGVQMDG